MKQIPQSFLLRDDSEKEVFIRGAAKILFKL